MTHLGKFTGESPWSPSLPGLALACKLPNTGRAFDSALAVFVSHGFGSDVQSSRVGDVRVILCEYKAGCGDGLGRVPFFSLFLFRPVELIASRGKHPRLAIYPIQHALLNNHLPPSAADRPRRAVVQCGHRDGIVRVPHQSRSQRATHHLRGSHRTFHSADTHPIHPLSESN